MLKEFKEFMMRGNVIDLAVAVIIGAAFGKIITGLVDGIIMPLIAALFSVPNVEEMAFILNGTPIQYGIFLQAVLNFLIVGTSLFFLLKAINKAARLVAFKKKESEDAAEVAAEEVPTAETYLKEIRDLLAKK
ncbi:large conductance mechanosensitive channel protein MscL [Actinomyces sp. zg-332]|uniref:large conductance mechanosensitive channel protein MscL n=1 Tax=Actinomyces sp. zg-332 TaxID=2708340 RepID=UPI0014239284|nr:large conductance mechanosensitive channel protein MscL [Actinomyces sp. zg-332]QPK94279.1 large conductance mechanosensitive channel protein MscL [Actinomyces sp. zg-332]